MFLWRRLAVADLARGYVNHVLGPLVQIARALRMLFDHDRIMRQWRRGRYSEIRLPYLNWPTTPCFEALLFAITVCGYSVRCALEDNDSGDIRFEKLCRLIADCDQTIHDLSRTQLGDAGLPRFNMPFELGLAMGARRFGGKRQKQKRACVMVATPFVLPRYLSDIAGNDPAAHSNEPRNIIRIVRDYFHRDPDGRALPGAQRFCDLFDSFRADLPSLAKTANLTAAEVQARRGYRNYMDMLRAFREALPEIAKGGA